MLGFFRKKENENRRIQELEQIVQELTTEIDKLKRNVHMEEKTDQHSIRRENDIVRIDTVLKSSESENTTNMSDKMYRFIEKEQERIPLPESLISYLPNADKIVITSYGDLRKNNGRRYGVGPHPYEKSPEGEYIQYKGGKIDGMESWDIGWSVFAESMHPFIGKYTDNIYCCAENLVKWLGHIPKTFEVMQNTFQVSFDSGYSDKGYKETCDCIMYRSWYHESYHDGGGSGSTEWYLYDASEKKEIHELLHERYLGWCTIPECKGYWFEDEHLYLVDPWGILGVFEFYYCNIERRDYDSDDVCKTIGIMRSIKKEI